MDIIQEKEKLHVNHFWESKSESILFNLELKNIIIL